MDKKKLQKIRKEIDRIDIKILNLIKKRTLSVDNLLKIKKLNKHIVDKSREKKIFKNIKKKSIKNNIDPKITKRIWKNMILSYIDFERRNFKKK